MANLNCTALSPRFCSPVHSHTNISVAATALTTQTRTGDTTSESREFGTALSAPVYKMAVETVLQILHITIRTDAGSPDTILGYFHVCSRWRRALIGDPGVCSRTAFEFRHVELVKRFLRFAGDIPLHLDFDAVLGREDMPVQHQADLVDFLIKDRLKLSNARHIKSIRPLRPARWYSRLRAIATFAHLQELHVHLFTVDDLPTIQAPTLLSLSFVTSEEASIPFHRFIALLSGIPSVRSLSLRSISCQDFNPDDSIMSVELANLRFLTVSDIDYSQYEGVRALIHGTPADLVATLSLRTSCPLRNIWHSLHIHDCTRLQATILPADRLTLLNVYDVDIIPNAFYPHEELGIEFHAGAGYIQKLYFREGSMSQDLMQDAFAYADRIDTVVVRPQISHDQYIEPLNGTGASGLRVVSWLASLSHPTVLVIDTTLRFIMEQGHVFVWNTLRFIRLHCRTHRLALREDDQAAVDAVADWLRGELINGEVSVELVGRKWRNDKLSLGILEGSFASVIDNRV